jgi:hypothetical protein
MKLQNVTTIRVAGEDFQRKFKEIKECLGLKSDAETVRFVVNWFWKKLRQDGLEGVLVNG